MTGALHVPVPAVIVGGVVSTTVRLAVHCTERPPVSVAVRVTRVVPRPVKVEPGAGVCVIVTQQQLSVATTAPWLAAGRALAHWTVTSAGMLVMTGAVLSLTVMVWVWLLLLPQTSVAV